MLILDANLWVAAFDPRDQFHHESVAVFSVAARRALPLAGPFFVVMEAACALARLVDNPGFAQAARTKIERHPALYLEPPSEAFLDEALRLGIELQLRAPDALYVATAARLGAPLLSWDKELLSRGGALSPRDWLALNHEGPVRTEP